MDQEQMEIVVNYLTKSYKNEKLMGTLVVIAILITTVITFPLTDVTIGFIIFSSLVYLKFLKDIKERYIKSISDFKDVAEK